MDKETEILQRLDRVEAKLDQVLAFTATLQSLAGVWMTGGRGKMLSALVRMKGGDSS